MPSQLQKIKYNCQWCADRPAEWWIKPHVGPQSRACTPCRDRVCRKDDQGKFIAVPYAEQEREQKVQPA